jgi:hypothetical protein
MYYQVSNWICRYSSSAFILYLLRVSWKLSKIEFSLGIKRLVKTSTSVTEVAGFFSVHVLNYKKFHK